MRPWLGCLRRGSDAAAARYPFPHLVLRWLNSDPQLPQGVVERVQAPEAEVFVSQSSLAP